MAAAQEASVDDGRLISLQDHLRFAGIVRQHTGIKLGENKRQLLSSRLQKRMRALKIASYGDYWTYLNENLDAELGEFVNAITTNLTSFFRENHHFESSSGSSSIRRLRAVRCGSGRRAARPARSPTASPWCSARAGRRPGG